MKWIHTGTSDCAHRGGTVLTYESEDRRFVITTPPLPSVYRATVEVRDGCRIKTGSLDGGISTGINTWCYTIRQAKLRATQWAKTRPVILGDPFRTAVWVHRLYGKGEYHVRTSRVYYSVNDCCVRWMRSENVAVYSNGDEAWEAAKAYVEEHPDTTFLDLSCRPSQHILLEADSLREACGLIEDCPDFMLLGWLEDRGIHTPIISSGVIRT